MWFLGRILIGDLYYQKAMALKQQVYLDSAAASLRQAVAWQPANALYFRELGRIYMAMSPWRRDGKRWIDQGIVAYRRSLYFNPYDSATLFDLGMAYVAAREAGEAQAAFSSGLRVDPNNPAFYIALGAIYELQGKVGEARSVLERGLALSPFDQETIRDQLRSLDQAATPLCK